MKITNLKGIDPELTGIFMVYTKAVFNNVDGEKWYDITYPFAYIHDGNVIK